MINKEAYQIFNDYVKDYDIINPKVELKVKHTYSVVKKSRAIAKSLLLDDKEIDLACLIALLHDIGRFEQLRIYNSFFDHQTIDHANFGVELLFDNNLIKLFSATRDNDQIIYRAIKNHNKFKIEESLNERELLHAKIIRDADKIDNLEIKCTLPLETIFGQRAKNIGQQTISDAVFQAFINHETILSNDRITDLDVWLTHLAYIFDLNFKYSFQCVLAHQYIDLLYNRFVYQNKDTKKKMLIIYQEVISYLKKNAKELI